MTTPTKEQILEAASTSKEVKEALQKLFPEVFEEDLKIELHEDSIATGLAFNKEMEKILGCAIGIVDAFAGYGKYKGHCFWVDSEKYNWELTEISEDGRYQLLIPTKK